MKFTLLLPLILWSFCALSQNGNSFYFSKDGDLLENESEAYLKIKRVDVSKKKIELNHYYKFNGKWKLGGDKEIVTRKKDNYFQLDIYMRGQVVKKNKIQIVDTTEVGYLIREYDKNFCQSECEVLYVFPRIYHGESKQFLKNGKTKSNYFYRNFKYQIIKQQELSDGHVDLTPKNDVDHFPQYPKGINQFYKDLLSKIEFPASLTNDDLAGEFLLSFTIDMEGKLTKPQLLQGGKYSVNQALLRGCSKIDVPWMPAKKNSEKVDFNYVFPIVFTQTEKKPAKKNKNSSKEFPITKVLMTADKMPEFPGGENGLRRFISACVIYPEEVRRQGIQGKVFVSFVIDTAGEVRSIKVVKSVHPLLDAEAKRVVSTLPKWIPGEKDGKRVCVSYTVPVSFVLR